MLVAIESYFHDALLAAVPDTVDVTTGPSRGPGAEATLLVEVFASGLKLELPQGEDLAAQRETAFFTQVQRWKTDGKRVDFVVPATALGQVVDVESPPGRPLRRGDDYALEERTVRLYRPPASAEVGVVAFLRGERAAGFRERRRCEVSLVTRAWGRDAHAADTLLASVLPATLIASSDLGNLDAGLADDSGVRLRLLRPVMSLLGIQRSGEQRGETFFCRAQAEFLLRGELEQLVTMGEPEPEGLIREVRRVD
ncbi:hypothetical protein [Pyxidicoccus trucidator]|uniref:hypothetical protein n=1 Tax=Pyxidicoccus trucidator TaxID=2709662 RepID=UPI0013DB9B39|nr:hypothetical protein [Pyxidicoccus trucidator]